MKREEKEKLLDYLFDLAWLNKDNQVAELINEIVEYLEAK